jgi:hypothetical protein
VLDVCVFMTCFSLISFSVNILYPNAFIQFIHEANYLFLVST